MVRIGARQSGPLRSGTGFEKAQEWPAAAGLTIFRWTSCSNSFVGRLQDAAPRTGPCLDQVPPRGMRTVRRHRFPGHSTFQRQTTIVVS